MLQVLKRLLPNFSISGSQIYKGRFEKKYNVGIGGSGEGDWRQGEGDRRQGEGDRRQGEGDRRQGRGIGDRREEDRRQWRIEDRKRG